MFHKTKIGAAAAMLVGGISLLAGAVQAQTDQRVEITGSRIKRLEAETSQPIFTLRREDIQAMGLTSVGDIIQNITSNGSTLNATYNNGGNGETRVSLRNLGSERTLVLVNGRRWIGGTGLGGAVDLNTIPSTAIDRIDVLKDGASVTYGSDAIAGVVNVILRSSFDGAELNLYGGRFTEGDGERKAFDVTLGGSGKRFRGIVAFGYVNEAPVMAGDRDISAVPIFGTGTAFGSSTGPNGRFAVCTGGTWNSTTGACSGTQTRPDGSGGQFTYNPGTSGAAWRPWSAATDIYNFAPDNYLLTPQERVSMFANGSYDLTDSMRFTMRSTFNNRKSDQLLAAMPIVMGTGPGAGVLARTVAISADSLYNPFGADVVRIQRRAIETGGRLFMQEVSTWAISGGLEGNFDLAGKPVSWELGATRASTRQSDTTDGLFNVEALRLALGPSMLDAAGNPVCVRTPGNLATVISGCVPMNLLGAVGSISPAALAYSSFQAHDSLGYDLRHYYFNASAEVATLPAGPLSIAVGLERRDEAGYDRPDALIATGSTTGNARTPTEGGYNVTEGYLELSVPLLKGLPAVRKLDLTLATRTSDYSNFGKTTSSKAGLRWEVSDQLIIRGNYSQGFRAPSILELYQGLSDDFPQVADPCSTTFGGGYAGLTAAQQARCHAQGVPVGGYDQGNSQIRTSVGGNPNLKPEKSKTTTLGFVVAPKMLDGFDASLDWWKIDLTEGIETVTAQTILNRCIREGDASSCTLFSRGTGGAITSLLSAGLNFAKINVEGYDLTINYRLPKMPFGAVSLTWDTTYLSKYENPSISDTGLVGRYFDRDNYWRIRSNLQARWEWNNFGATWGSRFLSKQYEDSQFMVDAGFGDLTSDPATGRNKMGSTTYHDITAFWKTPWKGRITLGINNVFDKDPPVSYSTFANSFDPQYEVPGRFVYFRYSQAF